MQTCQVNKKRQNALNSVLMPISRRDQWVIRWIKTDLYNTLNGERAVSEAIVSNEFQFSDTVNLVTIISSGP